MSVLTKRNSDDVPHPYHYSHGVNLRCVPVEEIRHAVANPDGVTADELDNCCNWIGWGDRPSAIAASVWPDVQAGRTGAMVAVRKYMSCRSAALRRRSRGDLGAAAELDAECDSIYSHLIPEWAKW